MDIPILYEDNHLLVVEKPVNIPVQADESNDQDILTLLKKDIKQRFGKPGNVYLALVHRIDRPVGGVMVFAKTSKAASRLSDELRRNAFEKKYLAVVHGSPSSGHDTLVDYLWKDRRNNQVQVVSPQTEKGKKAVLDYQMLKRSGNLSLLGVNLQTGRSHQIRVQLANIGHPIYGDQKYGQGMNKPGQQIALWSSRLTFTHPTLKEDKTFESLPLDEYPWYLWASYLKGGHSNV